MPDHYPGPWKAEASSGSDEDFVFDIMSSGPGQSDTCDGHVGARIAAVTGGPTAEADAKLIAAAPELLAALRSAMIWHGELTPCDEPDDGLRGLLLQMQSAIVKATMAD